MILITMSVLAKVFHVNVVENYMVILGLVTLFCVAKAMHSIWWRPKQLEKFLRRQGIRGTSYKLLGGDIQDIRTSIIQAQSNPMTPQDHHIAPRVLPFFHDAIQKYGKVCMIWIGTKPRVIVGEPEIIRQILEEKNGNIVKPPQNPLVDILQKGVATLDGERWSKRRRQMLPAFHLFNLKAMMPAFLTSSSKLIDEWLKLTSVVDGSSEVDVAHDFHIMTADAIARTAFGSSFQEGNRIFELQTEQAVLCFEAYYSIYFPGFRFVPTRKNRRRYKLDKEIKAKLREIIRRKEQDMAQNTDLESTDLLGILLQQSKEESDRGNRMSIEEVMEECKLFYIAGKDTTANLLTWTIVVLSMHPEWQERAREEVFQMCGYKTPNFETLSRFKTVTMILNEVLRLYPPLCNLYRYTKRKTNIGSGVTIPAGVEIFLNLLSLHHDPKFWGDDVASFNPERFSDGVAGSSIIRRGDNRSNQLAFFAFGWGPRTCLGQNFALLEAKLALALILQNFSFRLSPSYTHAPCSVITLHPQYGAPIILQRL